MFNKNAKCLNKEIETLRLELTWEKLQNQAYSRFINELKKFDNFKINKNGGITAYKKDEDYQYGTALIIPERYVTIEFR